jgi:hypothetical protein
MTTGNSRPDFETVAVTISFSERQLEFFKGLIDDVIQTYPEAVAGNQVVDVTDRFDYFHAGVQVEAADAAQRRTISGLAVDGIQLQTSRALVSFFWSHETYERGVVSDFVGFVLDSSVLGQEEIKTTGFVVSERNRAGSGLFTELSSQLGQS